MPHSDLPALHRFVLNLADDALIYGQRLCEWTSRGGTLEIDIALGNTALSYLGRARMLFALYSQLRDEGHDEDHYAMLRSEREYTNLLIYELGNGDFAYTALRQYFIDLFEADYLAELSECSIPEVAAVAAKAKLEADYSIARSLNWVNMLAHGTEESHQRLQKAVTDIWGYGDEFFELSAAELELMEAGERLPDRRDYRAVWERKRDATLVQLGTHKPHSVRRVRGGREGLHSDALGHLLADLQYMQRSHPGLQW